MRLSSIAQYPLAVLVLIGSAGAVLAQTASCDRYRAELASLSRAGATARAVEAASGRLQREISGLATYYRSIGCENGFFFRPAECTPIAQRIRALQANQAAVVTQAGSDPGALEQRRRQLRAAISKACDEDDLTTGPPSPAATPGQGGDRLVCVRTCDGYFFPLENKPAGTTTATELCKALCPNADVAVYHAPRDGNIEDAVSENGKPYMQLANALRYQRSYDPACSCKKPEETWAQTLQKAERMIASRKGDVVVTERVADRIFVTAIRAKVTRKSQGDGQTAAKTPSDVETTGSVATAVQRPDDADSADAGPKVRVIAPDLIPVPEATP
jgi:hypothetical protein